MEDWLPIEDIYGYEVSNLGRVRNVSSGHILGIYDNGHGVMQVVMQRNGKNTARAVHRLVADAFLGPHSRDYVPVHQDGDWRNNKLRNLKWELRWVAVARTKRLNRTEPIDNRKVRHVKSGEVYSNSLECAKAIDGIEDMVLMAAQSKSITYKGSYIEFVKD